MAVSLWDWLEKDTRELKLKQWWYKTLTRAGIHSIHWVSAKCWSGCWGVLKGQTWQKQQNPCPLVHDLGPLRSKWGSRPVPLLPELRKVSALLSPASLGRGSRFPPRPFSAEFPSPSALGFWFLPGPTRPRLFSFASSAHPEFPLLPSPAQVCNYFLGLGFPSFHDLS